MINEDRKKLYDALSSEYDLGTYEEFERNIGDSTKRRKLYDAAIADYDLGDFESYSKRIGPTHKESLDAFNIEHGSFLDDFEARDTAEIKNARAGMSSGIYVPAEDSITGEERQKYMGLRKQEEALKKAWYTSDEYLAQKDAEALQLAQMRKDINSGRLAYAQANPVIEGINPSATRGSEADRELRMYETASRIMDDAIKMHNAPSKYDGANVFGKFAKGAGATLSDLDFWSMGLTEIADNLGVRDVLSSVQSKLGNLNDLSEDAIENILSPAEKAVLQAWAMNTQEQLKRKDDLSRGYQAGRGAAESLGFMAEFALTGGVGKAATEGVESMTKWLGKKALTSIVGKTDDVAEKIIREAGEKITANAAGKYAAGLAESLAEAAGRTGVMPSTFRNISEKATEIQTDEEGNNYLIGMNNAFVKGLADSFIETLSEGGRVNALGELFGDVAGKIPAYKKMVDKLSHTKASELWTAFNSSGVMNTLRAGGWHGLGEEYLEEWYGNALRTITGVDKDALKDFATVDNQIVTLTSFLPMTIFGGTVSTAQVISAGRDLEKKADALKTALLERGYDEAQADNMIDMMRGATPAEVSETLSPIVNSVARRNTNEAAALMMPVGQFAEAVQRWQSFNTKYEYQEQEQRDNLRAQMEETMGQFWQEDENGRHMVQRAVNEKGDMVYLLDKPSAQDLMPGEITPEQAVPAVAADGRKIFVQPSDYQIQDELEMNDFLGAEIMAEKGNKEQARMIEEKEARIAAIQEKAVPGTAVNIGTEEAPVQAIIIQRSPDGVIVNMPDGQTRQMTYEEFGNYVGINAAPLTDAQIDEQEADALSADRAQREAALDQEYGNDDAAISELTEAEDAIEQPVEESSPLPLKADGSVDQTALWNQNPERWAEWNDEQRQDGGLNSLAYINGAIAKESARIAEMQAGYDAISDFDERDAVEREVAAIRERLQRLVNLRDRYVAQTEAVQVAAEEMMQEPQTEDERRAPLRQRAKELADKLGVKVNIAENLSDVKEEQAREQILRIDVSGSGERATGWYNPASGEVTIYLPHTTDAKEIERTIVHEVVAHKGLRGLLGTEGFNVLCDSVWDMMTEEERRKFMAYPGVNGDRRAAADEYIAHYAETLNLEESKPVWDRIMDLIMRILNSMGVNIQMTKEQLSDIIVASYQKLMQEAAKNAPVEAVTEQESTTGEGAEVISEEQLNAPNSGEASQITAADGEVIADTDGNGKVRFSIRTWLEGGRDYLAAWLAKDTTLADDEKADILARMDEFYQNALLYSDTYVPFGTWSEAGVRYDNNGNPLMSVIKANGDYAMNLDFSLVCKKRRPLNRLLRTLINRNAIGSYTLKEREIAEINWILQEHGFEVACALCFVDSKRYRVTGVADVFASLYNRLVKALAPAGVRIDHFNYNNNPNVDKVENGLDTMADDQLNWDRFDMLLSAYKPGSVEHKVAQYLREHPEARKLVDATDFIEAEGFESVKENNPNLLKFYNMKKGTGGPKASFGDVQYLNDILKKEKSFDAGKAYAVGGVRLQSFSDFVPHMYFDYMQLFTELAAKKLPLHAYTKEVLFAKIFGLTGAKINMSLVPAVVEGGIAPGLDAEGNYAWADPVKDAEGNIILPGQSFPYDEAMAIQNAEGYSKNCGVIAVGISDEHIEKMLDDPNIPFIIPYHKSSLNAIVARMTNIDQYKDYTNVQNTRKASGSKLDKGTKDFNFNEYLHGLGSSGTPQQAAQAYLDWCRENKFIPKFSQFAYHPNYYKLLQDFNTIDLTTGEYAPQGAVTMTFPTEQGAFGNVESLIQQGLQEDAELEEKMELEIDGIADQVLSRLEEISKEPKMSEKQQAKKMAEIAEERMARIQEKASGPIDLIEEARRVVEREDGVAFRVISQENYEMAERIISNLEGDTYLRRLEGEYELGKLAGNYAELADIIMAIYANSNYTPVGTALLGFFAENPDMHFPLLFNDSKVGKETAKAFAEELSKIDDPYALYFMKEAWKIHKGSLEQAGLGVKPSSTTKYNKAIDARAEEIKAAEVKGTAFNFKKQESSLDEIDAIFKQLNKDEDLALLHDRVMNVARTLGVRVSFAGKRGLTVGESLGDKVSYDYKFFNSPAVSDQKKCDTITHELIHAVTVYAIFLESKAPSLLSDGMLEAVGILRDVYNQIARDPAFRGEYGVTDVYEMVAELSNARFRDKLKKKNLFQRILDALKRLLGIDTVKEDSAYQVLSDTLNYIIDNYDQAAFDAYALYVSKSKSYGRMMKIEEVPSLKNVISAANVIKNWLNNDSRGKTFTLALPEQTAGMIRKELGRDYDSHNITANGIAHALKNHGEDGLKLGENSIPITKENAELIPYIMVAPDYVEKGSTDITGRESIKFFKNLSNGYVVVVEKEYKNSPDDMETINMWAEMSSKATNAQQNAAPGMYVQNAILSTDIAKIHKDAEDAILLDQKLRGIQPDSHKSVSFRITPEQDKAYMDAVEAGDMETAQRMVIEVAKIAMPNTKVVDKKGNPTVVYHGTKGKFNIFAYSREDIGFHFGTKGTARTRIGRGKDTRIMQVFLNLENPLIFDTDLGSWDADYIIKDLLKKEKMSYDDAKAILLTPNGYKRNSVSALVELRQWMSNNGYDGIIYPNWYESNGKDSYIAFSRSQIKSADPVTYDNDGNVIPLSERFNPESADIRFRVLDTTKAELKEKPIKLNGAYGFKLKSAFKGVKDSEGSYPYLKAQIIEVSEDYNGPAIKFDGVLEGFAEIFVPKGIITKGEKDNEFFVDPKAIENQLWDVLKSAENYYEYKYAGGPYRRGNWLNGEDIRFRMSNENQAIFVSNAAKAVEGIKQEKATPEQWLKMIEKNGGLKAGEDKWMGLSDWLKASDKKTLTRAEVLDFINENMIVIEEQHYSDEEVAASANKELNDKYPGWDEAFSFEWDSYMDEPYANVWDEEIAVRLYNDYHENQIELDEDGEFDSMEDEDKVAEFGKEIAEIYYRGNSDVRPIHGTRSDYQTRGLSNNREIALTVPSIESWAADDAVHFGDAGDGRAVAWIRFGETTARDAETAGAIKAINAEIDSLPDSEVGGPQWSDILRRKSAIMKNATKRKVLVIDEIQSKRHQEGRDKGYRVTNVDKWLKDNNVEVVETGEFFEFIKNGETDRRFSKGLMNYDIEKAKRLYVSGYNKSDIPDAPFDKNWHELAMKRMLRYAAENGYDVIAWTKGEQQAERYSIGNVVRNITADGDWYDTNSANPVDGKKARNLYIRLSSFRGVLTYAVNENGIIINGDYTGTPLANVVGKEMAVKLINAEPYEEFDAEGMHIGGEGMKGFYDKMLPAFMNKYGKKWGVKVEDIELPNLEESGQVMHSVPVTEEMKASVMEGQVMFRVRGEDETAEEFHQAVVDEHKSRYNDIAEIEVFPVNEATAKRFGYTLEELQKLSGLYVSSEDLIAIFAKEDVTDSTEVEDSIFHESVHKLVDFFGHLKAVGEWMWSVADNYTLFAELKKHIEQEYAEDDYAEEMMCYMLGGVMPRGLADGLLSRMPENIKKNCEQIFNEIGYDRTRESIERILRHGGESAVAPGVASEESGADEGRRSRKETKEARFRATEITPKVRDEMNAIAATAIVNGNYMKAPNGADTNLTAEQWAMVRTKNFKSWFGDWENDPENASKVVDENGEPKVVFHGGAWRPLLEEKGSAVFKMRGGLMGKGAYFTDMLSTAIDYAREKYGWEHDEEVSDEFLDDNGYITEVFLNIRNEDNIREYYGETYYLATNHGQIKSAVANNGEFSFNFDIRYRVNENPTDAQKEAGNYKMGHLNLDGYRITIENPKGSVRRGTDSNGNTWENTLNNDYGYIRGTEGVDGDHIDVYLSDNPSEGNVFVIDQVNPSTREFDEHKVMYGFKSAEEAREAYLANYSEGWNGLGTITEVTKDEFKKWIGSSHRKTKPFSEYKSVKAIGAQSEGEEMEDDLLPPTGTPTDEVVASGIDLTPAQTAELAGNIFAALPEESRKKITEGLNGNILGLQDAILQIPASLATKENWNDEDKAMADIVAEEVTKMAGEMTRPFSASEGLWLLYNNLNKDTDLISQASRALVQRNLGFDNATQDTIGGAKDGVRFRTVGDARANATASMYNRGAANVWTRLKESYVDMNASVEILVKAIEKRSGKVAQGFENILMALNQQSSKGLAAMESYTRRFLNPLFDAIRKIMDTTDFKYEDIVRHVILKHGLERNKKLAQRDAKAHYQEIYDEILSLVRSLDDAQKRTYLTSAHLKRQDALAKLATLKAADTASMTKEEKDEHKRNLTKAYKAVEEAEQHLFGAEKVASLSEAEVQKELEDIFKSIESGKNSVYQEMRKNDYSGISSMFYDQLGVNRKDYGTEEEYQAALMLAKNDRYGSLADIEAAAESEVANFESLVNTDNLWKSINKATKETLRQQYEANMISKDQYENLRGMFEYYVPLRGFKDNTAEDMYTYYRKPNSTGYTKPILGAEGRKTEAESPFGWIAAMAGSAIASNVKNEAKLALYYFVANRPDNGVATLSRTWFVHTPGEVDANGKKIFRPAYPPFSEDLSTDAAKQAYEDWQEQMKDLQRQGLAYEAGQRLNLGNAVVSIDQKNKPEHIVTVKVGGKDYTIVINGNPRAAQAINGDLNIESTQSDYSELFGPLLRWMSSVNTSYNPEFWITNMMRDMAFTMMAVNIKEDPAYRRKFFKNYGKAFKVIRMAAKNENGTIGDSYIEDMYKDFVKYGGVTGYTQIKDSETWEKEIENYLKSNDPERAKLGKAMRGTKAAFHWFHRIGESLEQVSRFAAFLTARETGRSISEAVNDAKEITVNFNRKGSGKMITLEEAKYLTGKDGQPLTKAQQWMAVGASSIAPLGRRFIMFFNAAIQGLNATYKLYAKNKKRAIGWALGYAAVGMMNAVLHAMLDDDDDYLDIPQYERRNSLMLGGNGAYFKWALPQEARAFYALGDLAVESVMGRNPHQNVVGEALKISTEILPVNPTEGWKAFMPSVAIPFIELMLNEDYKGDPIYNEQKWISEGERERSAKWSKAYQGTGDLYVGIAQGLNFITGGDEHDAGFINIQPEKMQHIVQSAFGGTIRTADKFVTTIMDAIDPEENVTIRQTPFLNRFLTITDERFRNVHVNDVYDYYKADAEHALTLEKKYIKDRDADALRDLRNSDEYRWAQIYEKYRKPIRNIQEKIKVADGTAERKELMKQQDELKRRIIKEISEL